MKKTLFSVLVIAAAMLVAVPAYAADSDGDGKPDSMDNCPLAPNGYCSFSESNCDVDGVLPVTPEELAAGNQVDWNSNGIGDACEDSDGDTIKDYLDNCPGVWNFGQDQAACQDFDGDLVYDSVDNCIEDYNPGQEDNDFDGVGNTCDNCMLIANDGQEDSDDDGFGDACAEDYDGDGFMDDDDNCPTVFNPGQENSSGSYLGDACESPAAVPSVAVDDEDLDRNLAAIGTNSKCTLSAAPAASAVPGSLLTVLMLIASAAIVTDFRRLKS